MKLRPREGVMTLVTPGSQATGSKGRPAFHGDRSDWVILTISEVFITAPPFLPTHPPTFTRTGAESEGFDKQGHQVPTPILLICRCIGFTPHSTSTSIVSGGCGITGNCRNNKSWTVCVVVPVVGSGPLRGFLCSDIHVAHAIVLN